jgi:hypothetical protein
MKRKPRRIDLSRPISEIATDLATPPTAVRESFVWCGVTIEKRFAQRPRVQHLEASQPRGSVVGDGE